MNSQLTPDCGRTGVRVATRFWAVTMFGTVVRSVLVTFLGAGIILFGGGVVMQIGHKTFLFQGLFRWLLVEFQLTPYNYYIFSDWVTKAGLYIGSSLLLVLLLLLLRLVPKLATSTLLSYLTVGRQRPKQKLISTEALLVLSEVSLASVRMFSTRIFRDKTVWRILSRLSSSML